jgi:hypothetical protein
VSQAVLRVEHLPAGAVAAAEMFHREWLASVQTTLAEGYSSLVIIFPPANYDHGDWRRAIARDLARQAAPARVNVIAGTGAAVEAALTYLALAPGVTGQYLRVEGHSDGNPAR